MASESSGERTVSITLPADLDDWLDEQASAADVEREHLLVQLLAAYRATAKEDGDSLGIAEEELIDTVQTEIEEQLTTQIDEQLPAQVEEHVAARLDGDLDQRIETAVEEILTDQVSEATNSVQRQLSNRIDAVEEEFDEKMVDVRERVIQLKKEADSKASADHSHPELQQIEEVQRRITDLEQKLSGLSDEFDELVPEHDETITDVNDRIDQMQDRLQTLAWVVSDLRDAQESTGGLEAVERIKRVAAKADIQRANCENCGDGVALSLLTDPECPHCNATVTNVEPASGWFGSPTLVTAAQLESGEQS